MGSRYRPPPTLVYPVIDGTGGRGLISLAESSMLSRRPGAVDGEVPLRLCQRHWLLSQCTSCSHSTASGRRSFYDVSSVRMFASVQLVTTRLVAARHGSLRRSPQSTLMLGRYDDGRTRKAGACRSCLLHHAPPIHSAPAKLVGRRRRKAIDPLHDRRQCRHRRRRVVRADG